MYNNFHDESHCPFDIWAPGLRTKATNVAFSSYAFRQQQIEDLIAILIITDNPNDYETQCDAYEAVGIDGDSLTSDEITYIEIEVAKRW